MKMFRINTNDLKVSRKNGIMQNHKRKSKGLNQMGRKKLDGKPLRQIEWKMKENQKLPSKTKPSQAIQVLTVGPH